MRASFLPEIYLSIYQSSFFLVTCFFNLFAELASEREAKAGAPFPTRGGHRGCKDARLAVWAELRMHV